MSKPWLLFRFWSKVPVKTLIFRGVLEQGPGENFDFSVFHFEEANKSALELEDWMITDSTFMETENEEKPLEIEDWMVDTNFFNID